MTPVVLVTADRRAPPGTRPTERLRPHRPEVFIAEAYADAVRAAGGLPLLVPPGSDASALIEHAHAVLLTGGDFDIDPAHYGQTPTGRLDRIEAARTAVEIELARLALARDIPLLGICGGMQAMAVAAGGSLIQDLPKPPDPRARGIDHEQWNDPAEPSHELNVEGLGLRWLSSKEAVNSTHHQAIDQPGEGLDVVARAPCGTVEALASPSHRFAVGVQWHPELLGDLRLYLALVRATAG